MKPVHATWGLLLCSFLTAPLWAEDAQIYTGRARELGTRDPVVAAIEARPVEPLGVTVSTRATLDGAFELSLTAGAWLVRLEAEGYAPAELALSLPAQSALLSVVNMTRVDFKVADLVVRGKRAPSAPSRIGLKRQELRRVAGVGKDALRAIQTLPGVVAPSDFSGQLAVRGGGPQDNLYYLDGVPWPVPYHYGGAVSTVHSDALDEVDLYPAAFPARWGGADGAILDARARPGAKDRLRGMLDVNLLLAEGLLEAPVPTGTSETASILVAGRRSYFDLILPQLAGGRFTAVPTFWDAITIFDQPTGQGRLRLIAMGTDDVLGLRLDKADVNNKDFEGEFRFRNAYQTLGVNWTQELGDWRLELTPYVYQTNFETSFGRGYSIAINPKVTGVRGELSKTYGDHDLSFGSSAEHNDFSVFGFIFRRNSGQGSGYITVTDAAGITVTSQVNEQALYAQDRWKLLPGLALTLGARGQRNDRVGASALDPRVNIEWKISDAWIARSGWGLYTQFPNPQQNDPDFGNPALLPNRTEHAVLGLERRLDARSLIKVETYLKTYRQRVVSVPDARLYANEGEGSARGVELFYRQELSERVFGWLSYANSLSERRDGLNATWALYQYDRPHVATLVANYDPKPDLSMGAKINWTSGPLITPIVGRIPDPATTSGWSPIYGQAYSQRLDDYLRLDVRIEKAYLFHAWKLSLYAEVLNVLDRPNPSGLTWNRDFSEVRQVNNLPRLPYIGASAEF